MFTTGHVIFQTEMNLVRHCCKKKIHSQRRKDENWVYRKENTAWFTAWYPNLTYTTTT